MADQNESTSITFKRRKFTIPETLDESLQNLANQHYRGNVSRYLRAAIEDHEASLTDNEALVLHRVQQQVKSLATGLESLEESISESEDESVSGCRRRAAPDFGTDDNELAQVTERVLTEFNAGESFRLADIVDRVDARPELIVRACEQLLDLSRIHQMQDSTRYRLASLEDHDDV